MADETRAPLHELTVTREPVSTLHTYHRNPRQGNISVIRTSLLVNGQYRPVVANRGTFTGRVSEVLAGNHTLMAARDAGWSDIAVCWVDVDDDHATRIVAADNRTADLGDYDERLLAELLSDLPDLDGTGYDPGDLEELVNSLGSSDDGGETGSEPDETPVPDEPVTVFGDVWLLGRHRLLCGDSTSADDVEKVLQGTVPDVVYADPPYGINVVKRDGNIGGDRTIRGKYPKTKVYDPVKGDNSTDTARDSFGLLYASYQNATHIWWGGNNYTASAQLPDARCWLVWDKKINDGLDFAHCELAWTSFKGSVRMFTHLWAGVWRATENRYRVHPNQKPAALAKWALGVVDKNNETTTVLDPFAGSGSSLIAMHDTDRTGFLIEYVSAYCDVICKRFQMATGIRPVLESTGQEHDFTADADG